MITSEITIAGETVTIGYCFATEIAFKDLAGEDITDFMGEVFNALNAQPQRMPDIKKSICLLLAASLAFNHEQGKEPTITDTEIMNKATPIELGTAIGEVLKIRGQFYHVPEGEPKDDSKRGHRKGKN